MNESEQKHGEKIKFWERKIRRERRLEKESRLEYCAKDLNEILMVCDNSCKKHKIFFLETF